MLLRNQSRRCDAANFTDLTMGGWGAGFEKARDAYASVGSTKKKALMEQMLKRLEEKPATSNASAGVNTPSKSPASRYSFNYDRFKNIEDSDDEEERGPAPSPPITVPTQTPPVPTNLPPKLVDAMMRAQEARSRGASPEEVRPTAPVLYRKIVSLVHVRERSAHTRGHQARALSFHYCCAVQLKMVEALAAEGLKDADPETKLEVIKMLIEGGVELPPAVLALASAGTEETKTMAQAEVVQEQLREMQQKMTSDLEALKKQQQELNKREDLLSSANTFDDLLKFMQKVRASGPAAFYSSSNAGFADPAIGRRQSGMSQEEIAGAMQAQERQDTGAVREILEKSVKRGIDTSGAVLAAKRLEENLRTVEAATASAAGKKGESKAKEDVGGAGKANTAAVKSQEPSTNSAELSADEQQKAADEKELGNVAFAAGKYTKALKHFSKAIELGGDCAAYLTNRAAALVRLERYAEALADVERALALDKTHVKAWFRKGQALEGLGRFADAVGAYEAGLRVLPDSPQLVKGIENARAKLAASSGADGAGGGGDARAQRDRPVAREEAAVTSAEVGAVLPPGGVEAETRTPASRVEVGEAELVVVVELPGMTGMQGVALDVQRWAPPAASPSACCLACLRPVLQAQNPDCVLPGRRESLTLDAVPRFALSLALPRPVRFDEARAKFVKKTATLKVRRPPNRACAHRQT